MRKCNTPSCPVMIYFTNTGGHINQACPACGKIGSPWYDPGKER